MDDAEAIQRIRANAELVIEQCGPICGFDPFGFNDPSVKWLDGYINRLRESQVKPDPAFVDRMTGVLGSFLGECIIRKHGGAWKHDDNGWRVEFDSKNAVFPFSKTEKQLTNGPDDSIYSLYSLIGMMMFDENPKRVSTVSVAGKRLGFFERLVRRIRSNPKL